MTTEMKWYVVHTYSGFEEKAKLALLERIKQKNCPDKFGQIVVPQSKKESLTKTGKRKVTQRASFPGYIMVEMSLDDSTMQVVKDTPKITGFVGNAKSPRPLSDKEVMRLVAPEGPVEQASDRIEATFLKGEGVKVIDGPFSNFDGIVDEVRPDKAKLRVLVKIFGRETPVELDYGQVEKIN